MTERPAPGPAEGRRMEALLDYYAALLVQSRFWRTLRVPGLRPARFFREYYYANRPVVFRMLQAGCPALRRWSPRYFAERCGDAEVEITANRVRDPRYEERFDHHRRKVTMREFARRVTEGGPSNDYYLVARNLAFENPLLRPLLRDLRYRPGFAVPLDRLAASSNVHLLFGPAGTITPLHHDLSNVLLTQVHGRKEIVLVPACQRHLVYNRRFVWSPIDPVKPDLRRFPRFRDAVRIRVIVRAGETLFIPAGWWHWVRALTPSITINQQEICVPGRNTALRAPDA
jgi:hypothetical protein